MRLTQSDKHQALRAAMLFPLALYLALFGPVVASLHLCEHLGANFVERSSIEEHATDHDAFSHHVTHCPICQQGGSAPALLAGRLSQIAAGISELITAIHDASYSDASFSPVAPRSPPDRIA